MNKPIKIPYAELELRVSTLVPEEKLDEYKLRASEMFNISYENVTNYHRQAAKNQYYMELYHG